MIQVKRPKILRGEVRVPGDPSITHRALVLGAISRGRCVLEGPSRAPEVRVTLRALRQMGVEIRDVEMGYLVLGRGMWGLREPENVLHMSGSGTTARLMLGLLAGMPFTSVLTGNRALRRRSFAEISEALNLMGALVIGREGNRCLPLAVKGGNLTGISYAISSPVAAVKTALLLAGLYAFDETVIVEDYRTRDHLERLLLYTGAEIEYRAGELKVRRSEIQPFRLRIPGDFTAAAPFLALASAHPEARLRIRDVGLNLTRTGFLRVLRRMGASVEVSIYPDNGPEPFGDILIESAALRGLRLDHREVSFLIGEIPFLMVVATQAEGRTTLEGLPDERALRVVEQTGRALRKMGAEVRWSIHGFTIEGPTPLKGVRHRPMADPYVVAALLVAGALAEGTTTVPLPHDMGRFRGLLRPFQTLLGGDRDGAGL